MASMVLLLLLGCGAGEDADPLAKVDSRFAEISLSLAAADRDTTRNVHNKDARRRKSEAEGEKVAFFKDTRVMEAILAAQGAPDGSLLKIRGDVYARKALETRAWTSADKAEETRLLGVLDEAASRRAEWFTSDGRKFTLDRSWDEVSREADGLEDAVRQELATAFASHRMQLAGPDLIALVKLRNEVAKRAGYANYYQLSLNAQGLSQSQVDSVVSQLTEVVRPFFAVDRAAIAAANPGVVDDFVNHPRLRRVAKIGTEAELADAFFDADLAEERIVTAYHDMGFDTADLQLYTGPSRIVRPGVYGFVIRPPEFVAIVLSVDERWSAWPYQALMHEAGHAVWWMNLSPESAASPATWEPDAPWFEGYAQFFERVLAEPAFTAKYVPELPEEARVGFRAARVRDAAEGIANAIVATQAERNLYESPDNLAGAFQLAETLRSELTGAPGSGADYDPSLLSGLLWHYPAYSSNYLFAYLTEARLWDGVRTAIGEPVGNARLGPFLVDSMVRQPATQSFEARLAAISPGDGAAALSAYLRR